MYIIVKRTICNSLLTKYRNYVHIIHDFPKSHLYMYIYYTCTLQHVESMIIAAKFTPCVHINKDFVLQIEYYIPWNCIARKLNYFRLRLSLADCIWCTLMAYYYRCKCIKETGFVYNTRTPLNVLPGVYNKKKT
jgi:hypothetical protein